MARQIIDGRPVFEHPDRVVTEDELALLNHICMWGSASYPIRRYSNRSWYVADWRSVKGPPTTYKTKREAVAAFERFIEVLLDAHAAQRYKQAQAEQAAV